MLELHEQKDQFDNQILDQLAMLAEGLFYRLRGKFKYRFWGEDAVRCTLKYGIRIGYRLGFENRDNYPEHHLDPLEKERVEYYVGINNQGQPEYKQFDVSWSMHPKIEKLNQERLTRDKKELEIKKKHLKYARKVYKSRTFPRHLASAILYRDDYTCWNCNTHKDDLPAGVGLEVDHVHEWEDGGETSYENGAAICSDCNKDVHHAKKLVARKKQLMDIKVQGCADKLAQ